MGIDDKFTADFKRHVEEFIIYEYEKKMPFRLIDTYTGLILKRSQITDLLKERSEYKEILDKAAKEAPSALVPERTPNTLGSSFQDLKAFIGEYLAFAMFSHRWGGREITIKDIKKTIKRRFEDVEEPTCTGGIYSIIRPPLPSDDLQEEKEEDFLAGIKKLQEFCCTAAKCGYRWAWADTCCIDEEVFGERAESINLMFRWYSNCDLTIVYLNDLDDVAEGDRLPAIAGDHKWLDDEEIQNPFSPSHPLRKISDNVMTLHRCHQNDPLRLHSMQPDTQVEFGTLEHHLKDKFPDIPHWKALGRYPRIPQWVTRGWTLQETLAPKRLRFYSKQWTLLEEADDRDTEEAESEIYISSFKFRARLPNHRLSVTWCQALHRTTGIPERDLDNFVPGIKDVRLRLGWAARRRTAKEEDMAYCLLGIFDITLPVVPGEGYHAFFRLQEEILKRSGDVSLFDWRGRNSRVTSFLAYSPPCFADPDLPVAKVDDIDKSTSIFRIILDLICAICGTAWSGVKAVVSEVKDRIMNLVKSLPPGSTFVNGGLNIPLLEHRVKDCEYSHEDNYHHYKLKVHGLDPTTVILASPDIDLEKDPKDYYLCRVWSQTTHNVFNILLELLHYVLQNPSELWSKLTDDEAEGESSSKENGAEVSSPDEPDSPNAKLRKEVLTKRAEVMQFFKSGFPVYLIRVKDGHRIRINTAERVVAKYAKFDFSMDVETRFVL